MSRYKTACGGNSKKAMTLYRKNLQLSQEIFTVISCFEIALVKILFKKTFHTVSLDFGRHDYRQTPTQQVV
ncbi:MAG: hypothetical protein NZM35_11370 [Chitinophagales bacterium]|nr:hypothetical protein [Chitinophagales bacterium]MDW8419483.1 hypothetical protein [Chitinophagales bacterium]